MKKKKLLQILSSIVLIIAFILLGFKLLYHPAPANEIKTSEETKEEIEINDPEVSEKDTIKVSPDVDLAAERTKNKNNDIVARLEIPDLFNILVVKGKDNTYYLDRSITKKKDIKGTEFMDYRNNIDDKQINIYGHNSRTFDIPFRKLENYLDEDFFNENPYIILQTENGRRIYKIFSIKEDSGDYEHMSINKTGPDFIVHMVKLQKDSIHSRQVEFTEDANLLILQTCSYGKDDTYYVISAIEI